MQIFRGTLSPLLILLCWVTTACSDSPGEANAPSTGELTRLDPIGSIKLLPDFTYDPENISGISVFHADEGQTFLTLRTDRAVYYSSPGDETKLRKIEIPSEGPNAMETVASLDGALAIGENRILYANHFLNHIYEVTQDTILNIATLPKDRRYGLASSFINRPTRSTEYGYFTVFPGALHDLSDYASAMAIHLSSLDTFYFAPYPAVYEEKYFSTTPYMYWGSVVYNSKKDELILSYPVDDAIYIYSPDGQFKAKYPGGSAQVGSVAALREEIPALDNLPDGADEDAYFRTLSYYIGGHYDPGTGYYYRIARKYVGVDGSSDRTHYLIVFNADYRRIGEMQVPDGYDIMQAFTTQNGGISIFAEQSYVSDREIALPFTTFQPK